MPTCFDLVFGPAPLKSTSNCAFVGYYYNFTKDLNKRYFLIKQDKTKP